MPRPPPSLQESHSSLTPSTLGVLCNLASFLLALSSELESQCTWNSNCAAVLSDISIKPRFYFSILISLHPPQAPTGTFLSCFVLASHEAAPVHVSPEETAVGMGGASSRVSFKFRMNPSLHSVPSLPAWS
jgi:hypothetical protein